MKPFDFLKLFLKGALEASAFDKLESRAKSLDEDLVTVVMCELLGIPNPVFYYTVELLPYLGKELESWRKSEKGTALSRALKELGEP